MDKIKSILASASGKRVGPPVPPRPSPLAVQKALEKVRVAPQISAPVVQGRTIIYSSTTTVNNNDHRQSTATTCETQCFDTRTDESETGFVLKGVQNGNNARFDVNNASRVNETKIIKVDYDPPPPPTQTSPPVILHKKSPVPRPRSKTPTFWAKNDPISVPSTIELNYQQNSYTNLLTRNQNSPSVFDDATTAKPKSRENLINRDDELKQKLLNEMLNRSNPVEASNQHVKYNLPILKRSSSFDALNEALSDRSIDKKVIFHEILISELSEMRREMSPRLSAAKSSPDISQNGNVNIFEIDDKKSLNTFVSLEDSGVEDEGKMDDCSSSGVGDSWDSCKEMENR